MTRIRRLLESYPIEVAELRASPKQLAFQTAFLRRQDETGRRCDVFAALGANRSGKTTAAGVLCFCKFLRDEARDTDRFWCIGMNDARSVAGQQQDLWRGLPRWMFGSQIWDAKIGFGGHRMIRLKTRDGGEAIVEFRTSEQDASTFEQARLRGIWADEYLPEPIYDRILARIIDLRAFILYSDLYEQWWHFQRLVEAKPEAAVFSQIYVTYDNEQNLPAGEIEHAAAKMTEEERQKRIYGKLTVMKGVVFKTYRDMLKPLGHLIRRFPIPADWPKWRLIDYGNSAPTACSWVALADNETAYVYREHYTRDLSCQKNAQMIITASGNEKYTDTFLDPHANDKRPVTWGPGPTIEQQYRDAGIVSRPWPYIQIEGEHACVARITFRLENQKLYFFEDLAEFRREMRSWKFKCDREGTPLLGDTYENDNNHLIDGLKGWLATNPTHTQPKIRVSGGGQ